MLSTHHITKTYGTHTVLHDITFSIKLWRTPRPDWAEWLW